MVTHNKSDMVIPNKPECFYLLEMLDSHLIDYSYTQPWADKLIEGIDIPPVWLCDIAVKKSQIDQLKAIREYVFSEPFEENPPEFEKFHVACLWLRYERRELSWATLLREIGDCLDAADGDWDCETPYHYLNMYEDADFTEESEKKIKQEYLLEQNILPWVALAREKLMQFQSLKKVNKA